MVQICSVESCQRRVKAKNFCSPHYKRWRRKGDPTWKRPTTEERYWSRVNVGKKDDCWLWVGSKQTIRRGKTRYGCFNFEDKTVSAHRFGWKLAFGSIPEGMHVLHKCDNPLCQNPSHLFLGTNQDNINDKMAKGRWDGGHGRKKCPKCGFLL